MTTSHVSDKLEGAPKEWWQAQSMPAYMERNILKEPMHHDKSFRQHADILQDTCHKTQAKRHRL